LLSGADTIASIAPETHIWPASFVQRTADSPKLGVMTPHWWIPMSMLA
jgi:hypothetical protein